MKKNLTEKEKNYILENIYEFKLYMQIFEKEINNCFDYNQDMDIDIQFNLFFEKLKKIKNLLN